MSKRQVSGPHKEYADMDATSTVETVETSDSGLTPSTILKGCGNAQNGVSVGNVPEPKEGYDWYVFRVSYGRISKVRACLDMLESSSYVPYHTVHVMEKGKRRRKIEPLISGIIFAYLTSLQSRLYTKGPKAIRKNDANNPLAPGDKAINNMFISLQPEKRAAVIDLTKLISYYYNHFETDGEGKNPGIGAAEPDGSLDALGGILRVYLVENIAVISDDAAEPVSHSLVIHTIRLLPTDCGAAGWQL